MSTSYISVALRRSVIDRAHGCCEYCLVGEGSGALDFVVDHIISEKHGGPTIIENLCLSCYWCNSYKGSDVSSVDWDGNGGVVPLFHPRQQNWSTHFSLDGVRIAGLTPEGRVTVFLLRLNASERVSERELLMLSGSYPCFP